MQSLTDEQLLAKIKEFLAETGMKPTRFGRDATTESGLVAALERGRSPSLKTANRVLAFMAEYREKLRPVHADTVVSAASLSGHNESENMRAEVAA
jgi:predicted transcriptional regulator